MSNKDIVIEFYEKVFNGYDLSLIDKFIKKDYIQHSPEVADGIEGFKIFIENFIKLKPHMEIQKVAEDGDVVFVFFKCNFKVNQVQAKVVDIYRLEDGMFAEHWDVIQTIEADQKINNKNGHF